MILKIKSILFVQDHFLSLLLLLSAAADDVTAIAFVVVVVVGGGGSADGAILDGNWWLKDRGYV